jgi:hypothetical protein
VDWCTEHAAELTCTPEALFLNGTPKIELSTANHHEYESGKSYTPVMERYRDIMMGYLERTFRVGSAEVVKVLRPIAATKGIATTNKNPGRYLSDIAQEQLPGWWLNKLFPSIGTKLANTPFRPLDNTVGSGFAMAHAYALAMALLYESSEQALASLPLGQ